MLISGTFLDEISHDIPSQNWGAEEWREDFRLMKAIGIDTVIMIRSGHGRWSTYPSRVLEREMGAFQPSVDLLRLFLDLAAEFDLHFYFGSYDSGSHWLAGRFEKEVQISKDVVSEVWERYGGSPAFKGFYLSCEVPGNFGDFSGIIDLYADLGRHCKRLSGGLPILISPYIAGKKAISSLDSSLKREDWITPELHAQVWERILSGIEGVVDMIAFQDGHVDYDELAEYLAINRDLAHKHGMQSWTNLESFDRDMPIKFLPIKWEKLLLKLKAAEAAGLDKAITFEFSHFLSPQSCYPQAHGLFSRYLENRGIADPRIASKTLPDHEPWPTGRQEGPSPAMRLVR